MLFNNHVAGTITAEGRELTKKMDRDNEEYWYNLWHEDYELHQNLGIRDVTKISTNEYVSIYGDSITGDSIVKTDSGDFTIKSLYDKENSVSIRPDKEVIPVDFKSLNWTKSNGVHLSMVKNIIRHKTSKEKWVIKSGNRKIVVTGDHSIIIFRNGVKMEIKPVDIRKTDKILIYKEEKSYG